MQRRLGREFYQTSQLSIIAGQWQCSKATQTNLKSSKEANFPSLQDNGNALRQLKPILNQAKKPTFHCCRTMAML
jgi:hypothetical protein